MKSRYGIYNSKDVYFVIDVWIHPLLEERGDLADVSISDIAKDDLLESPLIVSLKQQMNEQVVMEDTVVLATPTIMTQ